MSLGHLSLDHLFQGQLSFDRLSWVISSWVTSPWVTCPCISLCFGHLSFPGHLSRLTYPWVTCPWVTSPRVTCLESPIVASAVLSHLSPLSQPSLVRLSWLTYLKVAQMEWCWAGEPLGSACLAYPVTVGSIEE